MSMEYTYIYLLLGEMTQFPLFGVINGDSSFGGCFDFFLNCGFRVVKSSSLGYWG